jgi:hypothetical protein
MCRSFIATPACAFHVDVDERLSGARGVRSKACADDHFAGDTRRISSKTLNKRLTRVGSPGSSGYRLLPGVHDQEDENGRSTGWRRV